MKRFFLLLLFCNALQAYIYNDSLLLIYAKIVPRIMLLDHTNKKTIQEQKLCILYEKGDRPVAEKLKKLIRQNLPAQIQSSFRVNTEPYDEESDKNCIGSTALMLLDAQTEKITETLKLAKRRRLLTFSYSNSLLKKGAVISLLVGKEIYPIVNIKAVKSSSLKLDPMLFQIAKIYDGSRMK